MYVIVQQPNKKFAVWNTVTDTFAIFNQTAKDLHSMIKTRDELVAALDFFEAEKILSTDKRVIFFEAYITNEVLADKIKEAIKEGPLGWTTRLVSANYTDKTLRAILAIGNKKG